MSQQFPNLYMPSKYESRYALLAAFAEQFASAWRHRGGKVDAPKRAGTPSLFLFFNNPPSTEALHAWMGPVLGPRAMFQWSVDHPLTIPPHQLDRFASNSSFRLLHVACDDAHLLPLRFAPLRHEHIGHGIDESALCDVSSIAPSHAGKGAGPRDIDVLITGSIATDDAISQHRSRLPGALPTICDEIVALRVQHPWMSFGAAWDIAHPRTTRSNDHWAGLAHAFQYTTAVVNKTRRAALLRALSAFRVCVLGTPTMQAHCSGSVTYGGEVAYADLSSRLCKAKVCIALGPTQFASSYSERLLLSLGAGCATIADDRVMIRRDFACEGIGLRSATRKHPTAVRLFDAANPETCAESVHELLQNVDARVALGCSGRSAVAQAHLWQHRAADIATLAQQVMREGLPAAASA